ncbi:hypothetical protein ACQ86N_48670 [Puia sp. P3]|uniref:hypothetical protein n=1 Tax=Puia sp. P3 TaxID=3423952 RepID=UPI003D67246B
MGRGYIRADGTRKDKKDQEHILTRDFFKGSLTFRLHGHKLKGAFALVKAPARGDNAWLLIKQKR